MGRARKLTWSVNLGWWLAQFAPIAFGVTLVAIPLLIWLRGAHPESVLFWPVYAVALSAAAGFSVWRARKRFESLGDALSRLDGTLHLHNRLTSAYAGVGDWPRVPTSDEKSAIRWKLGRTGGLILCSIGLLVMAASVSISAQADVPQASPDIPPPLADVRTWTRQLDEEKMIDPKALEALEEKTEALLNHPQDSWYKAGALEAAEHLRDQMAQTLQNLDRDLAAIENAIMQAQAFGDKLPEPLAEALQKSLAEALKGLDLSALPMNALQREMLRNLDMKSLSKMTPEQLKELADKLKKNRRSLSKNGAMNSGKGKKGKKQEEGGIPVYLFAPGKKDPLDRLVDLVTPQNAVLVRKAVAPLTPAEQALIQQLSAEGKLEAYPEEGAEGEVEGLIFLPNPAGIPGVVMEEDELAVDALITLVQDPSMVTPLTNEERAAVLQALRDKRLRLGEFTLMQNPSDCQKQCQGAGGAMRIAICRGGGCPGGRGGGPSAPLTFDRKPQDLKTKQHEALTANDREHDSLGDVQGVGTAKHEVDESAYKGLTTGGNATIGDGGDTAWTDNLSPEERTTLQEYFK
jgi:hypothetical protein